MNSISTNCKTIALNPVIEHYKHFVNRQALRENLKLSPEQRLHKIQSPSGGRSNQSRWGLPGPVTPWTPVSDCSAARSEDPIIELFKVDVDRSLLRENLTRTPEARLEGLKQMANLVESLSKFGNPGRTSHHD